ncbi:hypothetical protein SUGI_0764930 [Cryptomeria japonica]|uniref:pentatricopeptide repeat-containing protein At1g09900 n=1 Tax=Cryptomeria japonica TaxID=3369 RepID=UPI002414B9DE|nr:pentatricopeptide repeat-containing protein At1g09900 [Cryptomeria japonica]XP_059063669.1 pentatricopeptide repeat-containing protein At1g09900 [Cryptomeria japonica]GLJ37651.1 hypothetical protein SUGI_0764930 [Cryptomeria japonica]
MATVHAFIFSRVENVYTICNPSSKSSRRTRKTVRLVGAKIPNVLPSFPVVDSICRSTSIRCIMGERLKQGRELELEDTLLCREEDRRKIFSEKMTAAKSLVRGRSEFWDLVDQISTSLHREHWEETSEITKLRSMKKDLKADVVLEVLKLQTNAKKALEFFHWAGKLEEYEHHSDSYLSIIVILSSSNMLDAAQAIIEQMNNNGLQIDSGIFAVLMKCYGDLGKTREALDVFDSMKTKGYVPGTNSYNTILVALVRAKELEMAESIYVEMLGYRVNMNTLTFTTMIHCLCLRNKLEEAKGMLENMLDQGSSPDVVTYTTLISSLCKRGKMSQAFDIFGKMQEQGCSPNVITYNFMIYGLCFVGKVEAAIVWLQKMPSKGCTPNIYSYTCVMDGLGKVGRTNEAKQLLSEAIGKGLAPTLVSYNALFHGYFREGRPDDALDLFDEMSRKGIRPNKVSYTTLIHGLVKWRRIPEALRLQDAIELKGYKLDFPTLKALLQGLCKEGSHKNACRLFRKMQEMGHLHDSEAYYMVINANLLAGEMEEALILFYELVRNNPPNLLVYNKVLQDFCINERLDDAIHLLKFMIENGGVANVTSYSILLKELCKEDRGDVARQFYATALKRGLFPYYNPDNHVCRRKFIESD